MATPIVLITGANGYLGTATTLSTLQHGYNVRAVVRRQDAVAAMSDLQLLKPFISSGSLTFNIVADYGVAGALDKAADGCTYLMHTAAPLPLGQAGDMVPGTVNSALSVLDTAQRTASVKRVVFTESIYAIKTWEEVSPTAPMQLAAIAGRMDEVHLMKADAHVPNAPPYSEKDTHMERYIASKIASRNAIDAWVTSKPERTFTIARLQPGYILGPDIRAKKKEDFFLTTNNVISFLFVDVDINFYYGLPPGEMWHAGHFADVQDCANAHVQALTVAGDMRDFLLCENAPTGIVWEDAKTIAKERLPVLAHTLPMPGHLRES